MHSYFCDSTLDSSSACCTHFQKPRWGYHRGLHLTVAQSLALVDYDVGVAGALHAAKLIELLLDQMYLRLEGLAVLIASALTVAQCPQAVGQQYQKDRSEQRQFR